MCFKHNILFYNLDQNVCFHCCHENLFLQNTKDDFSICITNDFLYLGNAVITVHTALDEVLVSTRIIFPEICHTHKLRHMCMLI